MEELLKDPITMDFLENAVVTPYGHSYSEKSIKEWLQSRSFCPLTQKPLSMRDLFPNFVVRQVVIEYLKKKEHPQDFPALIKDFVEKFNTIQKALFDTSVKLEFLKAELDAKVKTLQNLSQSKTEMGENLEDISVKLGYFLEYKSLLQKQLEVNDKNLSTLTEKENSLLEREAEFRKSMQALEEDYRGLIQRQQKGEVGNQDLFRIKKSLSKVEEDLKDVTTNLASISEQKNMIVEKGEAIRRKKDKNDKDSDLLLERRTQLLILQKEFYKEESGASREIAERKKEIVKLEEECKNLEKQVAEAKMQMTKLLKEPNEWIPLANIRTNIIIAIECKENGNELLRQGKYEEAVTKFSESILMIAPLSYEEFYLCRSICYRLMKQYQSSIEDCEHILKTHDPNHFKALKRLAKNYMDIKDYENAYRYSVRALKQKYDKRMMEFTEALKERVEQS
eukprot:TRINITY_DN3819_c0_g1_i1.p1 TRINITY_DN3819_c0_g1~~TRINITY_DN3819_c0_g1_i1.p1  ORF type:complete len:451 (+),score=71.88 TRINITY_DN3819_c0_g1_i1:27-1379(+)